MELEHALLGLIGLHKCVTGYELNRIIKESTGNLLSASLSQIYPALKRLHDRGLVTYSVQPLTNRPDKKVYQLTPEGEKTLQEWLKEPIISQLDFKAFSLRMAFSLLMPKEVILQHIDREIEFRGRLLSAPQAELSVEEEYLDKETFDLASVELLWKPMMQVYAQVEEVRLKWLKQWRERLEKELKNSN
jgi:PadR family transcriptional regulator, regulatory protein AphA